MRWLLETRETSGTAGYPLAGVARRLHERGRRAEAKRRAEQATKRSIVEGVRL